MKLFDEVTVVTNIDYIDDVIRESQERGYQRKSILLTHEELNRLQGNQQIQLRNLTYISHDWPHDQKQQMIYKGHPIVTAKITNSLNCDICNRNENVYEHEVKLCGTHYKVLRTMEKLHG